LTPIATPGPMNVQPYIKIARINHWAKNIFILPGMFVAAFLVHVRFQEFAWRLPLGILGACLACSANYVLNEWMDAQTDSFHPRKRFRPSVGGSVRRPAVYTEYALLSVLALLIGFVVSGPFGVTTAVLLLMGVAYNVPPLRTKDHVVIDVLSESFNNPLRLAMGWFIVTADLFPPSSLLVSYWMGGAFLMAIKRFAEFRQIGDRVVAGNYRRTFRYYTEETLLISSFFYAMFCGLLLGVFMVKYRIELLLLLPFVGVHFAWYAHLAFLPNSPVQFPERLHRQPAFLLFTVLIGVLFVALLFVDFPPLRLLLQKALIPLRRQ
jgi:decaprenyl-phosphate phosphoribosyltransferase